MCMQYTLLETFRFPTRTKSKRTPNMADISIGFSRKDLLGTINDSLELSCHAYIRTIFKLDKRETTLAVSPDSLNIELQIENVLYVTSSIV